MRVQVEAENRQLRAKLKQLVTIQDQNKVCIDQLLSRLQEVETARRSEQNTADALRQQVNAYREDFEGERLDRHRAQERVINLERQVAALKLQVHTHTHTHTHTLEGSAYPRPCSSGGSRSHLWVLMNTLIKGKLGDIWTLCKRN